MANEAYEKLIDKTRAILRELDRTLPDRDPDYRDFGIVSDEKTASMQVVLDAARGLLVLARSAVDWLSEEIECNLCGTTIANVEAAIDAGWIPEDNDCVDDCDFWGPACPKCQEDWLYVDPDGMINWKTLGHLADR